MKKVYKHMMNCTLHTRLMMYFSTLVICAMVLATSISYISSYKIVEKLAESFSMQSIESVIDNMNDVIQEAENLAALIESDSLFQKILETEKPMDIRKQYSVELQYDFELYRLVGYTNNSFGGLYVLGRNGLNFKSHNVTFQQKDFCAEEWYKSVLESDSPVWFAPQFYSKVSKSIDKRYIAMGYPIESKVSGEKIGIILIEFESEVMEYILEKYGNLDNGVIQITCDERVLFHNRDTDIKKNKEGSIFTYVGKLNNGWNIEVYIPRNILLGGMLNLGIILIIVIGGLILIAMKITDTISSTVTNPINRLIELMDDAEEQGFNVRMHVRYKDEIAALGNKFNNMMEFTRHLIEKNNREQENLREAELKALQMQINPHFLYNTLETVIWLIRSGDGQRAIYVVTALSKFFRIGLNRGRTIISLREELEHVREYVKIQDTRYRDRIDFVIQVDEEKILAQTVPKLVLQPLIENAIYHGIQEKESGKGKILVRIGLTNIGKIRISVEDDGIGMEKEQLYNLRKSLSGNEKVGFGLCNTNQRLCKYFGNEAAISVNSICEAGTIVSFEIPAGKEDYDKGHIG